MLKKSITFEDYNGEKRTKDYYFNFTKSELAQMENSANGGLEKMFSKISREKDKEKMFEIFKDIILKSYGEISDDGTSFIKKRNGHLLAEDFEQTAAFDVLYMELGTDADAALDFVVGILPKDMQGEVSKARKQVKDLGPEGVMKQIEAANN